MELMVLNLTGKCDYFYKKVVIKMIIEKAYAKLNLTLSILEKRDDGFHELESIMVPIVDLYDELTFEENDSEEFILVNNTIEDNSILKAAKAFQKKYNTKGAIINLKKNIPLEAGLAGGSADSSATLRGLNRLFNLNIPLKELEALAASLGSDNTFCLYNKAAICRGRGEKLEFINYDFNFNVYLFKPEFGLKTSQVFQHLKLENLKKKDNEKVMQALKENDYKLLIDGIYNDLLNPATLVEPRLAEIIQKIGSNVFMSGSGTTLYVISNENADFWEKENILLKKHTIKNSVND